MPTLWRSSPISAAFAGKKNHLNISLGKKRTIVYLHSQTFQENQFLNREKSTLVMPELMDEDFAEPEVSGTMSNTITRKAGGSVPV